MVESGLVMVTRLLRPSLSQVLPVRRSGTVYMNRLKAEDKLKEVSRKGAKAQLKTQRLYSFFVAPLRLCERKISISIAVGPTRNSAYNGAHTT